MFSNETIEKGTFYGKDEHHSFPHFKEYPGDKWNIALTSFQNRNTMNQVPFCYRNHCDVNMDYYGGGIEDYRKLYAYTLLPERI